MYDFSGDVIRVDEETLYTRRECEQIVELVMLCVAGFMVGILYCARTIVSLARKLVTLVRKGYEKIVKGKTKKES